VRDIRYKDPERIAYINAYHRRVQKERREAYLADKVCIDCGAGSFLEIDHIDPAEKISHRKIWIWCKERREAELVKCVVRCDVCHQNRHKKNGGRWRVCKPRQFCGL
jgi:hypothetical protein